MSALARKGQRRSASDKAIPAIPALRCGDFASTSIAKEEPVILMPFSIMRIDIHCNTSPQVVIFGFQTGQPDERCFDPSNSGSPVSTSAGNSWSAVREFGGSRQPPPLHTTKAANGIQETVTRRPGRVMRGRLDDQQRFIHHLPRRVSTDSPGIPG